MKLSQKLVHKMYGDYLKSRDFSGRTITWYLYYITEFFKWLLEEKKKDDLREVTGRDLNDYGEYLQKADHRVKKQRYTEETQHGIISILKGLFKHMGRNGYILQNPFNELEFSCKRRQSIRSALTENEINQLLESIEPEGIISIRDRCLFELLYCSGIRSNEASLLNITDIDTKEGKLFVKNGKGKKERLIPIGENVRYWLKLYIQRSRKKLIKWVRSEENMHALFLTKRGIRIDVNRMAQLLRKRVNKAGMADKKISPHILRHSFATHMVENGADIKHVQELLGHSSVQTTVIYTHFTVKSLKKLIKRHHPRENELYEENPVDAEQVKALQK